MKADAYARIVAAGDRRCHTIGQQICDHIRDSPTTPFDPDPDGVHLRTAYYVSDNPPGEGSTVKTRAGYWKYVEFGTGHGRAQPHVRPAIEAVRARHR